jgi:hypothetical protein
MLPPAPPPPSEPAPEPAPRRTVHCTDAVAWLQAQEVLAGCSIVTSLPDVSELGGMALPDWKRWFVDSARLVLSRLPEDGVALFYQTDIKPDGLWVDKGYLCSRAAEDAGCETLFHKVVCRKPAGTVTFGRPSYSHLLCYARGVRANLARATADVLPELGEMTWTKGMGVAACVTACRFILDHTASRTVVDPFCGLGTALAVANALGLDAVGVELSPKRARRARNLRLSLPGVTPPSRVAGKISPD